MATVSKKHIIFLALGANLGDRLENLQAAQRALAEKMRLLAVSPVYATPPWGYKDQPEFLNQVIKAETRLSPHALLTFLKSIETSMGRVKTIRNGPRPIDIDILFYDDRILETAELTIPHPRLGERAFVLVPLADLAPDLLHPTLGRTVSELLASADRRDIRAFST